MTHRDVNRIVITGRVHEAPELRFAEDGELSATFTLACVSRQSVPPDMFLLHARGERLATLCNSLIPGTHILAEGQLQTVAAPIVEGRVVYSYDVRMYRLLILWSPPDASGVTALPSPRNPAPSTEGATALPVPPVDRPGRVRAPRSISTTGGTAHPDDAEPEASAPASPGFELADLPF